MSRSAGRLLRTAAIAAAALSLAACESGRQSVGEALGLTYESPNPFNVAPRAPLRLPSDLTALPPPDPGAPSPLDPRPTETARAALSGAGAPVDAAAPTPGELALLDAAGAEGADPAIRQRLVDEDVPRERQFGLDTFFGLRNPDGSEEEILDPREEAGRLQEAGAPTPNPAPLPEEAPSNEFELPIAF